jgi:chorismate synthase
MTNSIGQLFSITTFGESHGPALGVVIDGCPSGVALAVEDLLPELARRRPGQSAVTTARQERDLPTILSGVFEGKTTGMPIAITVPNEGQRSGDYEALRHQPRPGHADETWALKYGHRDHRGGGRASGRETVARVIAGVVARKLLPAATRILGHALQIGPHRAQRFVAEQIEQNPVRCADPEVAPAMVRYVEELRDAHDSTGGLVEILVHHPPAGLGEPVFGKLEARLAHAVLGIGGVTGFCYGTGFHVAELRGSEYVADRRHCGGMLGGITTGEELRLYASVKPPSSIGAVARQGRHDPCIVPRVIPVLEAMVAITLADALLLARAGRLPG